MMAVPWAANGCRLVTKWLLMVFLLLFFLSGVAIIVVGSIALNNFRQFVPILGSDATAVPILLIVVGSFVIVVSILGVVGAIKESYGLLVTFAVLMLVIFILEIAGGIAAYVDRQKFLQTVDTKLTGTVLIYNPGKTEKEQPKSDRHTRGADNSKDKDNSKEKRRSSKRPEERSNERDEPSREREQKERRNETTTTTPRPTTLRTTTLRTFERRPVDPYVNSMWDDFQQNLRCCGVQSAFTWMENPVLNRTKSVPDSCCIIMRPGCGYEMLKHPKKAKDAIFSQGCSPAFVAWMEKNGMAIGGVGIGIAFLQVLGIVLACILAKMSKSVNKYDTV